jgi:hypothetical protein
MVNIIFFTIAKKCKSIEIPNGKSYKYNGKNHILKGSKTNFYSFERFSICTAKKGLYL